MAEASHGVEHVATAVEEAAVAVRVPAAAHPFAGVSNRALARALALARAPTRPTGPARGAGPAAGISGLNAKLKRPASVAAARKLIDQWFDAAVKAVRDATTDSTGASHAADIAAADLQELAEGREQQKEWLANFTKERPEAGLRDWWESFRGFTDRKRREYALEFGHNVSLAGMDLRGDDLASYERAFEGMPLDAMWTSPSLITFKRGGHRGDIGGETNPSTGEIEMFSAGMTTAPYRPKCPALQGLPTDLQSIRHEIGHIIEARLTAQAKRELFGDILQWRVYGLSQIGIAGRERLHRAKYGGDMTPEEKAQEPPPPHNKEFLDLAQELKALSTRSVIEFVDSLGNPDADDPKKSAPPIEFKERSGRLYWRRQYFLHSVGRPEELPRMPEFSYALMSHGEYVPELYAYAINRPEWLASVISKRQMKWWKETVFKVPTDPDELKRQLRPPAHVEGQVLADAERLFTWEQLDARVSELTQAADAAPVAAAAP